jgi:hypothetical protein
MDKEEGGGNTKEDNGGEMINVHYIQISKMSQ